MGFAFAKQVLPKIKIAAELGHLSAWHYAAMYDRIALNDGHQQRYGTQFSCVDGVNRINNLEKPEALSERRAEIGLEPIINHRLYEKPCER